MTFSEAISDGFSKYLQFEGRSSRSAYWWWWLFATLVAVAASVVDLAIGSVFLFSGIAWLVLVLPNLAVAVRRLHDSGRSGWWVLIWLIPILGWIVMLVLLLQPSEGPNQYGAAADNRPAPAQPIVPPPPAN